MTKSLPDWEKLADELTKWARDYFQDNSGTSYTISLKKAAFEILPDITRLFTPNRQGVSWSDLSGWVKRMSKTSERLELGNALGVINRTTAKYLAHQLHTSANALKRAITELQTDVLNTPKRSVTSRWKEIIYCEFCQRLVAANTTLGRSPVCDEHRSSSYEGRRAAESASDFKRHRRYFLSKVPEDLLPSPDNYGAFAQICNGDSTFINEVEPRSYTPDRLLAHFPLTLKRLIEASVDINNAKSIMDFLDPLGTDTVGLQNIAHGAMVKDFRIAGRMLARAEAATHLKKQRLNRHGGNRIGAGRKEK